MDIQNEKCVMVIDEQLPLGIIANKIAMIYPLSDFQRYTSQLLKTCPEGIFTGRASLYFYLSLFLS